MENGRLRLSPLVTLNLRALSSPKPSAISKVTDLSLAQAPSTTALPPRLRRPVEDSQDSASFGRSAPAIPPVETSASQKLIPRKRRAESDIPDTASLRIVIPPLKKRALCVIWKVTDGSRPRGPMTIVLPPRLRRPKKDPQHSVSLDSSVPAVPTVETSGSRKVVLPKDRPESDKPETAPLRITIPALKQRVPFVDGSEDSDSNDSGSEDIGSEDTYSECSDESEDDESEDVDNKLPVLHDQSDRERSSPDPPTADSTQLLTPPHTSRSSTPV
ncbi:hypothetical protein DFH29DRAFT_997498 [Suillus ampliporus]|nr:hypothetical protein DFH29DRAFT_997498 [Suillus ampliporus]